MSSPKSKKNAIWPAVAFVIGAVGGSVAKQRLGRIALMIPIGGLAAVVIDDTITGGRRYSGTIDSDRHG